MSYDISFYLGSSRPKSVSASGKIVIHHTSLKASHLTIFERLSKSKAEVDRFKKIVELNTRFYPALYQTLAKPIYPYWHSVFAKSWHQRFQSRFVRGNSKKRMPYGLGHHDLCPAQYRSAQSNGDTPPLGLSAFEKGADIPSFNRFVLTVLFGDDEMLKGSASAVARSFWKDDLDAAYGFLSFLYGLDYHHGSVLGRVYANGMDWKLNQRELKAARELSMSLRRGSWPQIEVQTNKASLTREQRPTACVYVGEAEDGRIYVGQTLNDPEYRWGQHRKAKSGPFKGGSAHVNWKVIASNINPADLDKIEAFVIGYFNSYEFGYNDNQGNHAQCYLLGCSNRGALESQSPAAMTDKILKLLNEN